MQTTPHRNSLRDLVGHSVMRWVGQVSSLPHAVTQDSLGLPPPPLPARLLLCGSQLKCRCL